MGNLLFSPSGRINPSDFMKGMMILAAISAVISLTGLFNFQLSQMLGLVAFLLIIPLFFLLIKRSHDAGKSGWMSIVWFILWLIVFIVIAMIMSALMPSAAEVELKSAVEEVMLEGGGFADFAALTKEFGPQVTKETALRSAVGGLIGTGAAAYVINLINKSDEHENQFGPETYSNSNSN